MLMPARPQAASPSRVHTFAIVGFFVLSYSFPLTAELAGAANANAGDRDGHRAERFRVWHRSATIRRRAQLRNSRGRLPAAAVDERTEHRFVECCLHDRADGTDRR